MTTYFIIDRKQSTTMRIDEIHQRNHNQHNNHTNIFGGIATPLAFVGALKTSNPPVPLRHNSNHIGISIVAPENEPLLPPPPPPPRNNGEPELAWPRIAKVYPSEKKTSPVKRTHSDRVTPTKEVGIFIDSNFSVLSNFLIYCDDFFNRFHLDLTILEEPI